ncbi:broad specificity phosphatase PhoE [Streptomyces sp. B4I13]|uniref:histidine phosphatase family protein n=1 Tax=Streptomyces sp. B4I13 TaxID=3042271 RepID=UPI0027884500|nr:histidine phosphatase family protein [Streptomyces sp. B4I13]MDQ0958072.1 broad specificity phosphatase PhoE [Streptomyces sp. B4I13]
MADIHLMRHGAYENHRPGYHAPLDAPLTAEGRDQVGRSLPLPDGITGILTSPILRARQTAAEITRLTGLPIITTTGLLAEWRAPTIVLGHTPDTYPPTYRAWKERRLENPSLRCSDGETLTELHIRATRCADFLHATAEANGRLLVTSHAVFLGVLTHLHEGPTAFTAAARHPWPFTERRPLAQPHNRPLG